jgi:rubrerythrin
MEEKEKLIQLVKKQIGIERELVKKIGEMEKKVGNAAAKMLLLEMRLDSQKHAGILTSILKVLRGVPPSQTIWEYRLESYVDPFVVKKELENHMKMESAVLTHVEEEIKQTKDEGLKLLLQHIADDEKKHHKILETIVKYSYKINP